MSKANNRKDIKQKEELQARFQIAISQANKTVLSWLKPESDSQDLGANISSSMSADLFLSLPVISLGSGLSLSEESKSEGDIHTIGDFINGDKKLSTLTKKKRAQSSISDKVNRINERHKVTKNDSKLTISLKNKLRDANRLRSRKDINKNDNNNRLRNGAVRNDNNKTVHNRGDDSDSDEAEELLQRSVKKGSNLLFDNRNRKK